jgi:lipopolysaccharide heptosyltransferase II
LAWIIKPGLQLGGICPIGMNTDFAYHLPVLHDTSRTLMAPRFSRILITRLKFIGDVVLTTPILCSIRSAYPDAYIAYLGEKNAVSLLEHNPHLNEIIPFDFSRPTIFEQPRVAFLLRQRQFDLAIDLFNNPRSALLTSFSGARVRVGAERKGRGRLYTIQVRDEGLPKTAIEFHDQFIRAVGIEPTTRKTRIYITEDERREARIYLRWIDHDSAPLDMNKPIVGFHPGATWPAKKWLPERFGELADMLVAKLGLQVVLFAGPNDGDTVQTVLKRSVANIKVLHNLPLRQLAAVISHCALFIGNDAGPMHIAAAVGTPTLGLFGPGEENIWFPYKSDEGHVALRRDVPCHPCHLDFCNREGESYMECMKLLSVEEVFATASRILRQRPLSQEVTR